MGVRRGTDARIFNVGARWTLVTGLNLKHTKTVIPTSSLTHH